MRFLPSKYGRTAAEVLLTTAIVAFVVYDLSGHSSVKPEATSEGVLSFDAKRPSTLPVLSAASSPSRFDAAVTGITAANTFTVCGNTAAPTNPWVIGNGTNQALIIQLGGGCIVNPAIQTANSTSNVTLAAISVASGSWLSFQNIQSQATTTGAASGTLTMASGSTLETALASIIAKPTRTCTQMLSHSEQSPGKGASTANRVPVHSSARTEYSWTPLPTTYLSSSPYIFRFPPSFTQTGATEREFKAKSVGPEW